MKAQTKALVASLVVVALALSAVSGITYSWFSDSETADIDVSTGEVDIELSNLLVKTYSMIGGKYVDLNGKFAASPSGGATVSNDTITISGMADNDRVEIYGKIINKSTINTKWRTTLTEIGSNNEPVTSNSNLFTALLNGQPTSTVWSDANAVSDTMNGEELKDGLLFTIELNNFKGQGGGSCKIRLTAEAYQSNADVPNDVGQTTVAGENTITLNSVDASSKLISATIVIKDADAGVALVASEVSPENALGTYSVQGAIAGIDLTSNINTEELFKGKDVTITMVLDGAFPDGSLNVYHGGTSFPGTGTGNGITVMQNQDGTTTVEIKTIEGFSPYIVELKAAHVVKTMKSGNTTTVIEGYYDSLSEANKTMIEETDASYQVIILRDISNEEVENIEIKADVTILGAEDGITLENVRFQIVNKSSVTVKDLKMVASVEPSGNGSNNYQHLISIDRDVKGAKLTLCNLEFILGFETNNTAAPVYVRDSGSLSVDGCSFRIAEGIDRTVKHHALELYSLSSVSITRSVFDGFSRPINLDGVSETFAMNNTFYMPLKTVEKKKVDGKDMDVDSLLKVYSINKEIESFSVTGDRIVWQSGTVVEKAPVYINDRVIVNGHFLSDLDVHIKDDATEGKLTIEMIGTIDAALIVPENAFVLLAPGASLTVSSISEGKSPACTDGSSKVASKTEDGKTVFTVGYTGTANVGNQNELNDTITSDSTTGDVTIVLPSNSSFNLKSGLAHEGDKARDVTFVGNGTQTIDVAKEGVDKEGAKALNYQRGSAFTFRNLTVQNGGDAFDGIVCDELTYIDCTIKGRAYLYGNTTFINCTFESDDDYAITTYGAEKVIFENCSFKVDGKTARGAVNIYSQSSSPDVIFNDCMFEKVKVEGNEGKHAAIQIGPQQYTGTEDWNVTINSNVKCEGFFKSEITGETLWNVKTNEGAKSNFSVIVTVDGFAMTFVGTSGSGFSEKTA